MILVAASPVVAQNKLAITDKAQFLTGDIETILRNRLAADSIELTSMIDTKRLCDYYFATLLNEDNELITSVLNCKDKSLGTRNLGSKIFTATDSEKALLLYFALSEILRNPNKNTGEKVTEPARTVSPVKAEEELPYTDPGQHRTRYFFAPSSYNLKKGELYYNTLYFLLHDVQYGISDKFSMGMGTTIGGFPFYLTPKFTIPVNDKSSFAIGDLLMIGTYGTKFTGNLLYTTYTRGGTYNNFTLGLGYLHTGVGDVTNATNNPVLNFSALLQVSDHIYFITENYSSQVKTKQSAYNENTYENENFEQKMFFIYGSAGFRLINKTKDVKSWQFGLSYIFSSFGAIPQKYNSSYWYTDAYKKSRFIAFPVIGYARKFSTRF
jgi:hypothetical protein